MLNKRFKCGLVNSKQISNMHHLWFYIGSFRLNSVESVERGRQISGIYTGFCGDRHIFPEFAWNLIPWRSFSKCERYTKFSRNIPRRLLCRTIKDILEMFLKGTVFGSLLCNSFFTSNKSTMWVNLNYLRVNPIHRWSSWRPEAMESGEKGWKATWRGNQYVCFPPLSLPKLPA